MNRDFWLDFYDQVFDAVNKRDFEAYKQLFINNTGPEFKTVTFDPSNSSEVILEGTEELFAMIEMVWFKRNTTIQQTNVIIDSLSGQMVNFIRITIEDIFDMFGRQFELTRPLVRDAMVHSRIRNDTMVHLHFIQNVHHLLQELGLVTKRQADKDMLKGYLDKLVSQGLIVR